MSVWEVSLADHRPGAEIIGRDARILILDVERLPGICYAWGPKTKYVPPEQFIEWPRVLCFAAQWYGHKRPIFEAEWIDRDKMIQRSWDLYDQADIVVTYYGTGADNPWLKTHWVEAGMAPPRPWKDVDLYRAVTQFGFESKSLHSVSRRLGQDGKLTRYSMTKAWACVNGDKAAQREMKSYNIGDVSETLALYDRLRGWIKNHPHVGTWGDAIVCHQCGSKNLTLQPSRYRAVLLEYALYRCDHCGANVRGSWEGRAAATRGV